MRLKKMVRKGRITKLLSSLCIVLLAIPLFAEVTLSDEEYEAIIKRLKRDKEIINNDNIRWRRLKKSKPKIKYEIVNGQVVIQEIEIPIYKAKPLIYEIKFKVEMPENKISWVPLTLFLCGMIESNSVQGEEFGVAPDVKVGLQFFSLRPLGEKYKVKKLNLGLNALIGIKSSGLSVSYSLPKPFSNTSIHLYVGFSYKIKTAYGLGVSLNF